MLRLPDSWLWDFWLAEDHGTYHLFFLQASRSLHDPDRRHLRAAIGHAISTDLIHWEQVTDALVHGDPGEFDATATWTGSVIKGPDGTWFMFYTGTTRTADGPLIQQVGLATSTDLYQWVKDERNPLVQADSRWYETLGGPAPWADEHWRDPFVMADPDGNGWHMLITARAITGPLDDRGVVGNAHSTDLINWDVQPPLSEPGNGFGQLEVFQVANVDGRHVLIFNCLPGEYSAARRATGARGAIWAATGESPLGPFDIEAATPLTDESFYVGKLVRDPSGAWVLLAFHNIGSDGQFGGTLSDPMPVRWDGSTLTIAQSAPSPHHLCPPLRSLEGMNQALPFYDTSLLIRTDFSDDDAWADVCASALAPMQVIPGQSFQAQLECVDNPGFAGLTVANLLTLAPPGEEPGFVFLADSQTIMGSEQLILAVDLSTDPSRYFRVTPDSMWSVENNLAQSNMNFADFLAALGEDGVFRGFSDP